MRKKDLRQLAVLLLTGVLLMPVLGKSLHAWEGHELKISHDGNEQLYNPELECSVCDYVQLDFHEDLSIDFPLKTIELIAEQSSCFASVFPRLFISSHFSRGPPR